MRAAGAGSLSMKKTKSLKLLIWRGDVGEGGFMVSQLFSPFYEYIVYTAPNKVFTFYVPFFPHFGITNRRLVSLSLP